MRLILIETNAKHTTQITWAPISERPYYHITMVHSINKLDLDRTLISGFLWLINRFYSPGCEINRIKIYFFRFKCARKVFTKRKKSLHLYTVCPRSRDPIYRVSYYIKWDTIFLTHSTLCAWLKMTQDPYNGRNRLDPYDFRWYGSR